MRKSKQYEYPICGWSNENDINQDALKLTNIIKRKHNIDLLPQLIPKKIKVETLHRKQMSNAKLTGTKQAFHREHFKKIVIKREKTEGYEGGRNDSPNFKNQKIVQAIKKEEEKEEQNLVTISPYMTDIQFIDSGKKGPIIHQNPASPERQSQEEDKLSFSPLFSKTLKINNKNAKSDDTIQRLSENLQSPKKTESKFYVKLSSLQTTQDIRKQLRLDLSKHFGSKGFMSEQRQHIMAKEKQRRQEAEILQKLNEKFREAFTKKDVFRQKKRKTDTPHLQPTQKINQRLISSLQTIPPDRLSLHSKLQALKTPHRYRLIFQ